MSPRQQNNNVHAASVRARYEELQVLLKRWQRLADRYMSSHPMCAIMEASLTMFHLISLNAVTNFPEIERLARREGFDGSYPQLVWKHKKCISDVEEALFHSGQVLRLIKDMPPTVRPPWWPGAIYRAALVLWAESLVHKDSMLSSNGVFMASQAVAIDSLHPDHPLITRYRTKRDGNPVLARRDGSQVTIENDFAVLAHCIDIIDEGVANRFSDGIRNKLGKLVRDT
jgi:hypothetical protein